MARKGCGVIQTRDLISNIRQKGAEIGAFLMVCTEIRSVCMTAWWGKISYIFWEIRTTGNYLYTREQGGCSCLCLGEGDEPVESLWVRVRR